MTVADDQTVPIKVAAVTWRISSFSGTTTSCVAIGELDTGQIAVLNSNEPEAGVIVLARGQLADFVTGVKAGQFDDLVT